MLAEAGRRAGAFVLFVAGFTFAQDSGPVLAPPAAAASASPEIPLWGPATPQPRARPAARGPSPSTTAAPRRFFAPRTSRGAPASGGPTAPRLEPPRDGSGTVGTTDTAGGPAAAPVIRHGPEPVEAAPRPSTDLEPVPLDPPVTLPPGGLPLEVVPEGPVPPLDPALQPLPDPESPGRSVNPAREEDTDHEDEGKPARPRRGLGALIRPRGSRPPAPPRAPDVHADQPDPESDAALQRRLERQIRDVAGRRLRALDVRVADQTIRIRARADRFWNRRGLRRTIEGLPALAGYDADITVD